MKRHVLVELGTPAKGRHRAGQERPRPRNHRCRWRGAGAEIQKLKSANAAIERRLAALEQLMTNPNTKEN